MALKRILTVATLGLALAGPQIALADDVRGANAVGGTADGLPQSATDLLRQQTKRCWRMPVDQSDLNRLIVSVRVSLNKDGTLSKPPVLTSPTEISTGDTSMIIAAGAALTAVQACAPYKLPPEHYEKWKDSVWRFDPRLTSQ